MPAPIGERVGTQGCDSRRLYALLFVLLLIASVTASACASSALLAPGPESPPGTPGTYRALFRVLTEGPQGKSHFRMAAALAPPDRLRLEFFGPVGSPRLMVAVDGQTALAIMPAEHLYDSAPATAETLGRLLGLPLDASQVVALLTGRPMCAPEAAENEVQTKLAATFGRTLAWYEVSCPPDAIRYQARSQDRGGTLSQASVRDGLTGAMMIQVEYEDHETGAGPRWPRHLRLRLARERTRIELTALEGPVMSPTSPAVFAPPIPEGFERQTFLGSLSAPGLLGSTADRGR